jgi:glycosyltransferase involved in cell wall biosynthesis
MIDGQLSHRYSDGVYDRRIAILGPYPPPLGGVSVHIQRVMKKFQDQRNTVYQFNTVVNHRYRYNPFYLLYVFVWLLRVIPQQVYYHTAYLDNSLVEMWLLVTMKRFLTYDLIFVEHDCRHLYSRSINFKNRYKKLMRKVDKLVLIGSVTQQSYRDAMISLPHNTSMEGAFLPPDGTREQTIMKTYPASLHAFMLNHQPLILANAFQLSCIQGKDLYGIDQCVHMLAAIAPAYKRIGFLLVLGQIGDEVYGRHLCFLIHKLQLAERVYIISGQRELWPLLKKIDLFVRPTLSDGASVSVQESLYAGTPTIASDVCLRPAGTILFSTGNVSDFVDKVQGCLRAN